VFSADEIVVMRRSLNNLPFEHTPNEWQLGVWERFDQLLEAVDDRLEFNVPG
jgi:hypothetical protein